MQHKSSIFSEGMQVFKEETSALSNGGDHARQQPANKQLLLGTHLI